MRILMVNNFARVTGGADRHCLELAQLLRSNGHQVAFLATASKHNVERAGVFVPLLVDRSSREGLTVSRQLDVARRALWNVDGARGAQVAIERFRPDVVHAHKLYPQLSVSPIVVAAREGVPIVQTLHDYELMAASHADDRGGRVDRHETKLSYRGLNTATYPVRRSVHGRRVTSWVAISQFVARAYESTGIRPYLLPNFTQADSSDPPPMAQRDGIVFAGYLGEEKGLSDVIELARRLRRTRVAIAGDGPLLGLVCAEARRLPNLTFLGFLDKEEVASLLRRARIAVIPSRWAEPGGLVALEAMAAGTPIVAYSSGGLREYVDDAGAGRIVRGVDVLARACAELHDNGAEWEALSRNGRAAVASTHSPARYFSSISRIYADAALSGSAG